MSRATPRSRIPHLSGTDRVELLAVMVIIYLLSGAALQYRPAGLEAVDPLEGNPLYRMLFAASYGVTLLLAATRLREFMQTCLRGLWIWALIGLCLLSTQWSVMPDITLRRGVAVLGTTLFGAYLAARYPPKQQLWLLAIVLTLSAALSAAVAVLLPGMGVSDPSDAVGWKGIYSHKNGLGGMMALAALVLGLLAAQRGKTRTPVLACLGLVLALVALSRSATAVVVLASLVVLGAVFRVLRFRLELLIPGLLITLAVLLVGGIWLVDHTSLLLGALGRGSDLTGRTELWGVMWAAIQEQPWLGYGFEAFWARHVAQGGYLYRVLGWTPFYGHNGPLDLTLSLGFVGLAIFLLGFWASLVRALRRLRQDPSSAALWPVMYLSYLALYNVSESTTVAANSLTWALYVSVALMPDALGGLEGSAGDVRPNAGRSRAAARARRAELAPNASAPGRDPLRRPAREDSTPRGRGRRA